ncbi:Ig domain-containing protein [Subtercola sp. YIM 133946]|uniref:Ig domain-containing protein n=1 Tax=Subtercola sp. YIM 133946 TaxID=3118909 RepID=UPI002F923250
MLVPALALAAGLTAGLSAVTPTAAEAYIPTAPVITSDAPPPAMQGVPYSFQVTATGWPAPRFDAGGLPAGLTMDEYSGVVSGIPKAPAGSYTVQIVAEGALSTLNTYTLVVTSDPPVIVTTSLPPASQFEWYAAKVRVTGNPLPIVGVGHLPAGLSWDASTGTIVGKTTAPAGTYQVLVLAKNIAGAFSKAVLDLVVK